MAINKSKLMDAARKFSDKGQTDKAIKEYLKVVEGDPKDVRVWLKIGDLYAKKGSKEEATETYLKVAKFYGEQGFYLKAVAVYKQILKLDPRLVEINLKLAELYRQLGLLSDAMQHFEMVAAHFHREGKTKEALATIRQLVDLDPENVATRIKLAELYSKEGMTEDAVKEFAHACDFLRKAGRTEDFVKVAERLLWHKPDNLALHRELAQIYVKRNDPRRALQKLQTCFKANPRDLETLAQLAQAFQALDQKAKTVSVLKEMARVLVENGQKAQAEEVHRKILAYAPNDPDSRAFLGDGGSRPAASQSASAARSVTASPVGNPAVSSATRAAVVEAVMGGAQQRSPMPGRMNPARMTGAMPLVSPEPPPPEPEETPAVTPPDEEFVAELALEDDVELDAEAGEQNSEEIAKVLTEADVYVKYGLHQKAIDHLRRVFALDAGNLEARERLRDIFLAQGREADAIGELLKLAESCGAREPERAAGYLREVLRHDGTQTKAFELAERFGLDLTEESSISAVEIESSSGGAVAVVEDEVQFDDLDFDGAGASAAQPSYDADGFEFELDDEPAAAPPAKGETSTVEVALEQVEEAMSVAELDGDELDFDAVEPSAEGLSTGGGFAEESSSLAPYTDAAFVEPSGGFAEPPLDEFIFDPDDAREFDNDHGFKSAARPLPGPTDPFDTPSAGFAPQVVDPARGRAPAAGSAPHERPTMAAGLPSPDLLDDGLLDGGFGPPPSARPTDPTGRTARGRDTGSTASLEDELDEADFFVTQGLYAEARDILEGLLRRYPNHPLALTKLGDLEAAERAAGDAAGDDDPAMLLDAISEVDVPSTIEGGSTRPSARAQTRPAVMLEKPIDETDADTHIDLGLAYREMGLFEEAIKAFAKVRSVRGREVQSHHMIGMCHRDQGGLSEAINQFKAGLYVDNITPAEKFGLYYEIGTTYELLDDPQEALYYYEMVLKKDPGYRDVVARVAGIKAVHGSAPSKLPRGVPPADEADAALDSLFDSDNRGG